jgi:hypothetical protein
MDIRRTRKLLIVLSLVVMVLVLGACEPFPLPCIEVIYISSPAPGMSITSPVTVMGYATSPFEGVLVRVLDSGGQQIGFEETSVAADFGQCGSFTVSVPFTASSNSGPGLIQVFTDAEGMIHLNSVRVQLQP